MSVTTDTSLEEDDVDDLWESFDRLALARRNQITEEDEMSGGTESEYPYSYSSDSDFANQPQEQYRKSRVSAGLNGRPLLDFPVPRGVDAEALCNSGVGMSNAAEVGMEELLLKASRELRDGTRAGRDLLRAMRLEEVVSVGEDGENDEGGGDQSGTVRMLSR
jgi:protein-serine/threonine kinase